MSTMSSALNLIQIYGESSDESSDEECCSGFDVEARDGELFSGNDVEKLQRFRSYFATLPSVEHEQDPSDDAAGDASGKMVEDSGCNFSGSESDSSERKTTGRQNKSTKKEIRKRDVAERRRSAHKVIWEDCGCSKECGNLVSRDDKIDMNKTFWSLDAAGQKHFIRERVMRTTVQRRSRNVFIDDTLRKHHSYNFHMRTLASDEAPTVCRKFFLNTLGYGEHCGNIIYRMVDDGDDDEDIGPRALKRGKYERSTEKCSSVKAHITKYNPTISHYRRAHAPNRLYLPSDLSVKKMHQNYNQTHEADVSYQFYCRILKKMNISMVKLGHEECEICISALQHQKTSGHSTGISPPSSSCAICEQYQKHLQLAKAARTEYREDGDSVMPGHVVLAVDLQKVIQLPRLDGLKTVVFSQRLIAFNETFAPVGKYTRTIPVVACVWNESVSGRSSNDITGCFHRVIERFGGVEKLVLWLDNCAAQNKNWNLFLHLIILVNSKNIHLKELVLKFFEPGHTFMAADSFHASVENAMRRDPPITYPDFKTAVGNAKGNVEIKPRPYIDNIRHVVVQKGSWNLHYSCSVDGSDLKSCKIFTNKQEKLVSADDFNLEDHLKKKSQPRGIDAERKSELLKTILPLLEEEKKAFWMELPQTEGEK